MYVMYYTYAHVDQTCKSYTVHVRLKWGTSLFNEDMPCCHEVHNHNKAGSTFSDRIDYV